VVPRVFGLERWRLERLFHRQQLIKSCRHLSSVTVFSERYFLTVNQPPFSPALDDANCTSTI